MATTRTIKTLRLKLALDLAHRIASLKFCPKTNPLIKQNIQNHVSEVLHSVQYMVHAEAALKYLTKVSKFGVA